MQNSPMASERPLVVVGAGHGGANLVALLRQDGFAGEIVMFGDEEHTPYHRPPLSKKFMDDDSLQQHLRPPDFYRENAIALRLGSVVSSIDPAGRTVTTSAGERVAYEYLVLATGSRPRSLTIPGTDGSGVLSLRTLDDAGHLRRAIERGGRLVIVGGGYIGLEVAAHARTHGIEVTILEREARVLARVASPGFSDFLTGRHRAQGIDIRTAVDVVEFVEKSGSVVGVDLAGGERIECDSVLVGVGAVANDDIAREAGIACQGGILVDDRGRTNRPGIYAIGDVTCRPLGDGFFRFESIPSALEQAKNVAAHIVGSPAPRQEVPWFWSDQFDLKLKIAGHVHQGIHAVRRGDEADGKVGIFHLDAADRVVAAETANAPALFMAAKKFIANSAVLNPQRLADAGYDLRDCVVHGNRRE
ncbi:ferredoxin reductase [Gordonia terrae]|uniref:Ferredoxin reductase n=2 Tax=Gordonia terrae TaxID=2055 RepID=A0A2I1R411_9ACTN|nr:ferredoxin reductase [Gordonia terrae]